MPDVAALLQVQQSPEEPGAPQAEAVSGFLEGLGLTEFASIVHRVMNFQIFEISGQAVTVMTIVVVGILIIITWWVSHFLQGAVDRAFRARGVTDRGTTAITQRLLHYSVMALGLTIAIQQVGINLSALFAAGAIFAVGIGFAMQNIAQNFVSGLILLVERAIKPGDIVEAEGRVVRVLNMGIRTTIAKTRDDEAIIIPNSSLVQSTVKNFTLGDPYFRIRVDVGVSYGSDMPRVAEALERAGRSTQGRFEDRDPVVLLRDFGDSSVNWQLSVWTSDAWTSPRLASELRRAVWESFQEADIEIAFPQMDVHFDPPVEEAVTRLPRAG